MKGIVLAGGKGSRLRPFTYSGAKQLVPIANTPVLYFPVRQLVEAGITDIAIVTGDTGDQIRAAMGDGSAFGARFTYVPQPAPLGIADGVRICREFVGEEPFVLYLGDNVLRGGITSLLAWFAESSADAAVVLKAVDDPRAFGVAEMAGERLLRVHEKPDVPPSNLAVIGVYALTTAAFDVIGRQLPSARGELEIADTINGLLAAGCRVLASTTSEYWIDTGKMEDILAANRAVLDDLGGSVSSAAVVSGSTLSGMVSIGAGACVEGSTIEGPVVIGANVLIRNCRIGPHVAIGDDCALAGVAMEDSIVMEQAVIEGCPGIAASMIGRFARICGAPAGSRLTLGDHSRFEVSR